MATINGIFSCGHAGSVYYVGRAKDSQWRTIRMVARRARPLAEYDAAVSAVYVA